MRFRYPCRIWLQELQAIVPMHPSISVQPLLLATEHEPGMIDFFKEYPWFLHIYRYVTREDLERNVKDCVLEPIAEYLRRRSGNDGAQPKRPSR